MSKEKVYKYKHSQKGSKGGFALKRTNNKYDTLEENPLVLLKQFFTQNPI